MSLRDCLVLGGEDMMFTGLISSSQPVGIGVWETQVPPFSAPISQTMKLNRIQIVWGHPLLNESGVTKFLRVTFKMSA